MESSKAGKIDHFIDLTERAADEIGDRKAVNEARHLRRIVEFVRMREKRARRRKGRLLSLAAELAEAIREYKPNAERRAEIAGKFGGMTNPRKAGKFVGSVKIRLMAEKAAREKAAISAVNGHHAKTAGASRPPARSDLRLENIRKAASETETKAAKALYQKGLAAPTRREQLRLFGQAVAEERRAIREHRHRRNMWFTK